MLCKVNNNMHYIIYSTLPHYSVGQIDIIKHLTVNNEDEAHACMRDIVCDIIIEKYDPKWKKKQFYCYI